MKHTVATCAHLLTAAQWRLVDAARAATARGASGCTDGARHGRGARHEARGARGARWVRCDRARRRGALHEVGGAGTRGARRVHPVRTYGRPYTSITDYQCTKMCVCVY